MTESSEARYSSFEGVMNDGGVSEIMVNGPHQIYVEKPGKKILTGFKCKDEKDFQKYIQLLYKAVGKKISNEPPYGDATFADGTRLNAILSPVAKQGSILTIRKFMNTVTSIEDLISGGKSPANRSSGKNDRWLYKDHPHYGDRDWRQSRLVKHAL